MATKRQGHKEDNEYAKDKYSTYVMPGSDGEDCSYGANCWLYNFPSEDEDGVKVEKVQNRPVKWNWRTSNIRSASRVPVFGDCMWRGGGPFDGSEGEGNYTTGSNPPDNENDYTPCGGVNAEMRHFCVNRHDGSVNHLFMDSSARKVGIKELWKLKWHRTFDTNGAWTISGGATHNKWPGWMKNFSDY